MSRIGPDPGVVDQLVNMGFEEDSAKVAVYQSHNCGVEAAVNWLMEHADDANFASMSSMTVANERAAPLEEPAVGVPADVTTVINPGGDHTFAETLGFGVECKAVLVVANNLYMSPGKVASQCAHAAVGLYKLMMANRVPWYQTFESGGEKTVVVSAPQDIELESIALQADQLLLPNLLISDAGRTEVLPGSVTVLGIAGPSETVDRITGHFELLK